MEVAACVPVVDKPKCDKVGSLSGGRLLLILIYIESKGRACATQTNMPGVAIRLRREASPEADISSSFQDCVCPHGQDRDINY